MRDWYLYAPAAQINEATRFYIETIARAGRALGRELRHVQTLAEVPSRADVLTVECKSAFKLRLMRPRARFWLWLQGVTPEEARLQFNSRSREALWNFFERRTLRRAAGKFMVSNAMRTHYAGKYGIDDDATFVMPCVNVEIDQTAFDVPGKYARPRFVYAGSLHAWQCFDLTLETFRIVKSHCPAATLTILTGEQDHAERAVAASGLAGIDVGHVPLAQLREKLSEYKYGFVLRRPHVVNAVATPTKVSSYMASGVIPIMTTAVHDYAIALSGVEPTVICDDLEPMAIARKVLELEAKSVQADEVLQSYARLFRHYFSHARYADGLCDFLRRTGLADT